MRNILFVSIDKIKEKSIFGENTDEKIIKGALIEVQDLELIPLIGNTLFNKIADEIDNDVVSDDNKRILTDYLEPYLIYGTLIYSVVPLHFKLNNKGLNKSTDSNLGSSDSKDLESFKNYYREKFEGYKRKVIEYFKCDENDETITAGGEDTTTSSLGFYLPDAKDYSEEYYNSRAFKTGYLRRY